MYHVSHDFVRVWCTDRHFSEACTLEPFLLVASYETTMVLSIIMFNDCVSSDNDDDDDNSNSSTTEWAELSRLLTCQKRLIMLSYQSKQYIREEALPRTNISGHVFQTSYDVL